jgi:hypothetical protein
VNTMTVTRRRTPQMVVAALVTLGVALGALPGASWSSPAAQAAEVAGETLQDYAARGGVQDSAHNLSSPSAGVSRVRLEQGKMNGYKVRGKVPTATESTLTYSVRVPKAVHDGGLALVDLKMPGLAGSPTSQSPWYASSGGTLQPDSWSVRLHARKSSSYSVGHPWWDAYIYAPYAGGKTFKEWGIQVPLSTGLNGAGSRLRIPTDRWFDVKVRVELNTPGANNGELDIWIDGQQGVKLRDVRWRAAGHTTPINLLIAETFYNNPGAPKTGHIDFTDFRVTQGPQSGGTSPAPAPVPTSSVPPVRDVSSTTGWGKAAVRWSPPSSADFAGVAVVHKAGRTPPTSPTDGRLVYRGTATMATVTGLTQGKYHSVAIFPIDTKGNYGRRVGGVWHGSTVSSTASRTSVGWGQAVVHRAVVRRTDGRALAGVPVELYVRKRGGAGWTRVATATTSTTGTARLQHRPSWRADYQVRFPGKGSVLGSGGPAHRVDVAIAVPSALSRATAPSGATVTLSGAAKPDHAGRTVHLERRVGTSWRRVTSQSLSSASTYRFSLRRSTPGTGTYRVVAPGDSDHGTGVSTTRTIRWG